MTLEQVSAAKKLEIELSSMIYDWLAKLDENGDDQRLALGYVTEYTSDLAAQAAMLILLAQVDAQDYYQKEIVS